MKLISTIILSFLFLNGYKSFASTEIVYGMQNVIPGHYDTEFKRN